MKTSILLYLGNRCFLCKKGSVEIMAGQPINKNTLIAEILYIVFLYYKGINPKYPHFELKNDMKICSALLDIMGSTEASENETEILKKGIVLALKYIREPENNVGLTALAYKEITSTEPLLKMKELVHEIILLLKSPFNRKQVSIRLFALHNLPRAYLSKTEYYLIDHKAAISAETAMEYCSEYLSKQG